MTKGSSLTSNSQGLPTQIPQEKISTSEEPQNPILNALNLLLAGLVPGEKELASIPGYSLSPLEHPEEQGADEQTPVAKNPIRVALDFLSGLAPGRVGGIDLVGGFGADAEEEGDVGKPIPPVMSVLKGVGAGDSGSELWTTPVASVASPSTTSTSTSSATTTEGAMKALELRYVNTTEKSGNTSQSATHSVVKVVKISLALAGAAGDV